MKIVDLCSVVPCSRQTVYKYKKDLINKGFWNDEGRKIEVDKRAVAFLRTVVDIRVPKSRESKADSGSAETVYITENNRDVNIQYNEISAMFDKKIEETKSMYNEFMIKQENLHMNEVNALKDNIADLQKQIDSQQLLIEKLTEKKSILKRLFG